MISRRGLRSAGLVLLLLAAAAPILWLEREPAAPPRETAPAQPAGATNAEAGQAAPHLAVVEKGKASYYADEFNGKRTADGESFNQQALTAASKDLPLGAVATVTNLESGDKVTVKINDRGPYVPGRIVDLSKGAASTIGITKQGVAPVKVEAKAAEQPTPELKEKVAKVAAAKAKHDAKHKKRRRRKTVPPDETAAKE